MLARDILVCFGKAPENNRAFYEFMIYRNVQEHGDSRQKKIIMKTTKDLNENQRNIYLSCRWKLDALQDFNLFETPVLHWTLIDLIEGQVWKRFIGWFLICAQFKNFGVIFDKKQNYSLNQMLFKPLFLKVNWRDFSETFTWSNYMLEESFNTRIPFSQVLLT